MLQGKLPDSLRNVPRNSSRLGFLLCKERGRAFWGRDCLYRRTFKHFPPLLVAGHVENGWSLFRWKRLIDMNGFALKKGFIPGVVPLNWHEKCKKHSVWGWDLQSHLVDPRFDPQLVCHGGSRWPGPAASQASCGLIYVLCLFAAALSFSLSANAAFWHFAGFCTFR